MSNFNLLINFIKDNSKKYILSIIFITFASVTTILTPLILKTTIDSVIGNTQFIFTNSILDIITSFFSSNIVLLKKYPWICGLILIILTILNGVFIYVRGKLSSIATESSCKALREKLYSHIIHLPSSFHSKSDTGDLIQRCTSDVETIQKFYSSQLVEIGQNFVTFAFIIFVMLELNFKYTLVAIIFLPIILFITISFFINMKKRFQESDEADAKISSFVQENITGIRVVKAFGAQKFEMDKFELKNSLYREKHFNLVKLFAIFWSSTDLFCLFQFSLVIVVGIHLNIQNQISIGTLVAFSTYSGMLIWPLRYLGELLAYMGQSLVSLRRIQDILDHPIENSISNPNKKISGNITFKNIYFGYEKDIYVLKNLNFEIKKGQTIAFLGSTGSGKSSITNLILRLYDYQKGSILIDENDLMSFDRKFIRSNIGVVLQEPFLFTRSIKQNILLGNLYANEDEILDSSKIASFHDSVKTFADGYDTIIGERGITLSGGQKQRLAIARAVIKNVPILIFDDSLSAIDTKTDESIRKALKARKTNTTTILISHRILTLKEADKIFVLEDGQIVQSGTHEELISQNGLYYETWKIQSDYLSFNAV